MKKSISSFTSTSTSTSTFISTPASTTLLPCTKIISTVISTAIIKHLRIQSLQKFYVLNLKHRQDDPNFRLEFSINQADIIGLEILEMSELNNNEFIGQTIQKVQTIQGHFDISFIRLTSHKAQNKAQNKSKQNNNEEKEKLIDDQKVKSSIKNLRFQIIIKL